MSEKQPSPDNPKQESLSHSSWDLVHSKHLEDVKRGIAMLQSSLPSTVNQLQQREELYLLAVGYYKCGDYLRSRDFVVKCLKIAPDWRQVLSLKAAIDDRITKGSLTGWQVTGAFVAALITGWVAEVYVS
ncbi:hypothetical protein P8452_49296 [Trifolium repens]|nr:hypothetical protein P8452_49296 [Trifolium repens]